jgi:preprotein translocase subunit SecE
MDIYKRGQGVYARGLALVIFILFVGWGCYEVYRIPAEFSVIVRTGKIVDADLVKSLAEENFKDLRVKGLVNQNVGTSIIGLEASDFVEHDGERIILGGEKYTKPMLKALEDAGILFVPVAGKTRVPVEHLLPGMVAKSEIKIPRLVRITYVKLGEPLTEDQVRRLKQENQSQGGIVLQNVYPGPASWNERDESKMHRTLHSSQVKAGAVLTQMPPPYTMMESILLPQSTLTDKIIENIKKNQGAVRAGVDMEDSGRILLTVLSRSAKGRYLRSAEQKRASTWVSSDLFTVPLVKLVVTPILLIALGLFILGSLGVLYSWNLKRWNDLLIETQLEMKKVSWPKRQELIGSSVIVIFMVLVLGLFLYLVDLIFTFLSQQAGLYPS